MESVMKLIVPILGLAVVLILVINCSNGDSSKDSQPANRASGNQPDKNMRILFQWPGDDFATRQELETRDNIGRIISEKQIGKVIRSGTGMGWMDIVIEVEEKDSARRAIQKIIKEISPESKFTVR
jgi:hypothetical protein